MLRITITATDSSALKFSDFESYGIPAPPNGADPEINDDLILQFEDEEEAVIYAQQLEELSLELKDKTTPQNIAIGDIIMAIRNDEFVQSYIQ